MKSLSIYSNLEWLQLNIENTEFRFFHFIKYDDTLADNSDFYVPYNIGQILHVHSYYELFVCTCGTYCFTTQDGEGKISEGQCVIFPPDYRHTIISEENPGDSIYTCGVICERTERESEWDLWRSIRHIFINRKPVIYEIGTALALEFAGIMKKAKEEEKSIFTAINFFTMVEKLSNLKCTPMFEVSTPPSVVRDSKDLRDIDVNRVIMLEQIINHKFVDADLKAEQIAEALFVSRRQLDRISTSRYGMTIRDLLNQKRLESAKKLLETTSEGIETIARQSGFQNKDAFLRNFRKEYGITPSEYRKNSRN